MIKSWVHKGLKLFFETGKTSGIQPNHADKLRKILGILNSAIQPEDMNLPGLKFHKLEGNRKNYFAVSVNKNWRITFKFEGNDAIVVNYEDYH